MRRWSQVKKGLLTIGMPVPAAPGARRLRGGVYRRYRLGIVYFNLLLSAERTLWNIGVWSGGPRCALPPAEAGRDVLEDRLDDVGVVVDAELVGHGQEQRVGLGDGFVLLQLIDQDVRLGGVAAPENGA